MSLVFLLILFKVFNDRTGELVGYAFNSGEIANHVLVFMVAGIAIEFEFPLAYFGTRNATADDLYPLLWKAIGLVEIVASLKVCGH